MLQHIVGHRAGSCCPALSSLLQPCLQQHQAGLLHHSSPCSDAKQLDYAQPILSTAAAYTPLDQRSRIARPAAVQAKTWIADQSTQANSDLCNASDPKSTPTHPPTHARTAAGQALQPCAAQGLGPQQGPQAGLGPGRPVQHGGACLPASHPGRASAAAQTATSWRAGSWSSTSAGCRGARPRPRAPPASRLCLLGPCLAGCSWMGASPALESCQGGG